MKRIILFILVLFLSGCSIKDKDNVQTLEREDKVEIKEEEKYIDDNPIKLGIFLSDNNYSNKEVIKDTYYANLQSGVDIASFEVFFTDEEIINGSNFKNTWNKYYANYTNGYLTYKKNANQKDTSYLSFYLKNSQLESISPWI